MYKKNNTNVNKNVGARTKNLFFTKNYKCPLCSTPNSEINYKNPELIRKFTSERGRILPSRITNICASQQRRLKKAIKRARYLALLPFIYQPQKGY